MNEKLHYTQIAVIVYMIQSGVILFALPRIVAEAFGTNGWLGLFPLSAVALANIVFIILVYKKGNGQSVFTILEQSFPKWLCYPIYLFMIVSFSLLAVLVAKNYIILIQNAMFPEVSANSFLILFLITALFFLSKGIYNMGKITLLFFFMTIWTIFLLFLLFPEFSFTRLTPFIFKGQIDPFEKGFEAYTAFLGFELVLFLFPYVQNDGKFGKAVIAGHLFTTFIYVSVCFVAMGFYSFEQVKGILYPMQNLLKFMETPLIERIENIVFVIFFIKIIVTVTFYYWGALQATKRIFIKTKEKWLMLIIVGSTFFSSLFFEIKREVDELLNVIAILQTIFSFSFPLLLLLLLWLQKAKAKRGNKIA